MVWIGFLFIAVLLLLVLDGLKYVSRQLHDLHHVVRLAALQDPAGVSNTTPAPAWKRPFQPVARIHE